MNPKVSLVLPVYNGAKFLAQCIESILSQTFADFEVLIGEDSSTDDSLQIIQQYRDPRIIVTRSAVNRGLFPNLNHLLRRAKGDLVRFLCQDDALEPACLETEVKYFQTHPEILLSIARMTVISEAGEPCGESDGKQSIVLRPERSREMFIYHGCIAGNLSTVCMRRECFERGGGFDERFKICGDYEMWTRIASLGPVVLDLTPKLVRVRRHRSQLSCSAGAGATWIKEDRIIRQQLLSKVSHAARSRMLRYIHWRQDVLATHHFAWCLLRGRLHDCRNIANSMGLRNLCRGVVAWILTINNHLYKPRPTFGL